MGLTLEADAARIFSHTDMSGDCWLWQGRQSYDGYARATTGSARVGNRKTGTPVHRWVYEYIVEPIPAGLCIDHRCGVRHCLNPAHMETVTPEVNTARMFKKREALDICARGLHLFSEHGAFTRVGKRYCRTCVNANKRAKYHARKAVAA